MAFNVCRITRSYNPKQGTDLMLKNRIPVKYFRRKDR